MRCVLFVVARCQLLFVGCWLSAGWLLAVCCLCLLFASCGLLVAVCWLVWLLCGVFVVR